jgi:membrane protease YdiL (CAAX protease family)
MSPRRTILVGFGFGAAALAHIALDGGRGAPAQAVWPTLAGLVPVLLAARSAFVSPAHGAKLGALSGIAGGMVLLLLGTPFFYLAYPSTHALTPVATAIRVGVGMLNAAIYNIVIAALVGFLAALIWGRRRVQKVPATEGDRAGFWRQFVILYGAGLLGILSLLLTLPALMADRPAPVGTPDLPPMALAAISLINPAVLLVVAVAVGIRLAPGLGFRSYLAERGATGRFPWYRLREDGPTAVIAGSAAGIFVAVADATLQRMWPEIRPPEEIGWSVGFFVSGLLYGGITEELLLRWGLLTALAWAGWRTFRPSSAKPPAALVWTAIVLTALVFGAAHLPTAAGLMPLTMPVVVRIVSLNAAAGIVFGFLFWRRSLEAAMIAHAMGHVIFAIVHVGSLLARGGG